MKQKLKRQIEYTSQTVPLLYSSPKNPEPKDLEKVSLTLDIVRDRINDLMNQYRDVIGGTYVIEPLRTLRKPCGRSIYKLMFLSLAGEYKEIVTGTLLDIDKVVLGYRLKDEELIG
jgi:hypothetical protein